MVDVVQMIHNSFIFTMQKSFTINFKLKKDKIRFKKVNAMKVDEILHMEGGHGHDSYSNNSSHQKQVISKTREIREESVKDVCYAMSPKTITIAELGCSSGPNAFDAVWDMINLSTNIYRDESIDAPEYCVFLNDLVGNDFNNLYRTALPDFQNRLKTAGHFEPCFVSGIPGSFYGRLFPCNSIYLLHASSCLHFLSQVPEGLVSKDGEVLNKGVICITEKSPPLVREAYYQQFADDFTLFLNSRAREIVPGGQMILTFRITLQDGEADHMLDFKFLGMALQNIVLQGKIKQEDLDSYNLPFYTPTLKAVEKIIEEHGSFRINKLDSFTVDWVLKDTNARLTPEMRAKQVTHGFRAAISPILAAKFDKTLVNDIWDQFEEIALGHLHVGNIDILCVAVSLIRN